MRQLPVQIVPGLQTPFLLHSGPLSNTQPCSIASHPSGPHACLLAETHNECCSCQQRRISLPLLAPSKPSWQANGHRKVCMQKLKWDMCTRETLRLARRSRAHPGLVQRQHSTAFSWRAGAWVFPALLPRWAISRDTATPLHAPRGGSTCRGIKDLSASLQSLKHRALELQ